MAASNANATANGPGVAAADDQRKRDLAEPAWLDTKPAAEPEDEGAGGIPIRKFRSEHHRCAGQKKPPLLTGLVTNP